MSSGRGYALRTAIYIAAYVLAAAFVWGIIGIVCAWVSSIPLMMPLVALAYGLWFGLLEALGLPSRAPGLAWQIPSGWIDGRPWVFQTVTWGATLGPGLLTRNPYAGMWLLPLLLTLHHSLLIAVVVGVAVGAVHGGARVLGVLSNRKRIDADTEYYHLQIVGAQLRWQYFDGLALLLAAGALAAYVLALLGKIV